MGVFLIILVLVTVCSLISSQLTADNLLLNPDIRSHGEPLVLEKCSWLPRCYCKDESEYTNGTYLLLVNCTGAGLVDVPKKIPTNTTVLTLNGNNITDLYRRSFENLTRLLYLDLSRNGITYLLNETFTGLGNLQTLELEQNKIRYNGNYIPEDVFKPLKSLTRLNLQQNFNYNDVETNEEYPSQALSSLVGLKELLIDGLQNKTFAQHFSKMKHLKSLELSGNNGRCSMNRITKHMFKFCRRLASLSITNCHVHFVEQGCFSILENLTILDLSFNEGLEFKSLANITSGLQNQNLSVLRLIKIHHSTAECVTLEREHVKYMRNMTIGNLFLDSNRLASVSTEAVDYLPRNISGLSLRGNMILAGEYLFKAFRLGIFSNLKYIDLSMQNINTEFIDAFRNNTDAKKQDQQQNRYNSENIKANSSKLHGSQQTSCINCIFNIYPFKFTETLLNIDASDMRVRLELQNICVCKPNNIQRLNLQRNIFWNWQGPFKGLDKLLNLNLAWNSCERMSADVFHEMPALLSLNLSRNFIESFLSKDLHGEIFKEQQYLESLDLSDNKIRNLPTKIFVGLKNLKELYLSRNFLITFEVDINLMAGLSWLDISSNLLTSVAMNTMDALLQLSEGDGMGLSINLLNNNLSCDCSNTEFVERFSKMTKTFIHLKKYTCKYETGVFKNLSNAVEIDNELQKACADFTLVILVSSISLFVVLVAIATGIVYRYKWDLRYLYYSAKLRYRGYMPIANDEDDIQFEHDVFVSYCDENRIFVRDILVPELEERRNMKVMVHDRDFIAGNFVNDNIMKAIASSRKTLIVMSRDYLNSKWCVFEMNMARMEAIKTGRNVLCVIMLEPIRASGLPLEIMDIIRQQTYLEIPEGEEYKEVFWDRVKGALTE